MPQNKMPQGKWQWMDKTHGPMGWFTGEQKKKHETDPEFSAKNGEWRAVPPEEVAAMNRTIGHLAYEQS